MEKLRNFMKNRPHDKNKNFQDAVIEYIEKVENTSIERYEKMIERYEKMQA